MKHTMDADEVEVGELKHKRACDPVVKYHIMEDGCVTVWGDGDAQFVTLSEKQLMKLLKRYFKMVK